jgi:PHD/YefM family antitoxin component YafN of YafNO toxin-antitoxin module
MENKVDYTFTRHNVETIVGRAITDKEWEVMSSELEDALDFYFFEEVPRLFEDIDELVAEDSKYD